MKYTYVYMVHLVCACLLLILTVLGSACKKAVTVTPPANQVVAADVFAGEGTATAAIVGMYAEMMRANNNLFSGGTTLYTGLSADNLVYNGSAATQQEFAQNRLTATNSLVNTAFWRVAYTQVYAANAILEGLAASEALEPAAKNRYAGEALFVRAMACFYLVNLFGDVPLVLSTDYRVNALKARTPAAQVLDQVVADLTTAKEVLPAGDPSGAHTRPGRDAALALLARVQLYREQWAPAEAAASEVINSGRYALEQDPAFAFLSGSHETIWQLLPVTSSGATWEGANFIPASATAKPQYSLSPSLLAIFDSSDKRKAAWTKAVTVGGKQYVYPFKYKLRAAPPYAENYVVLRLAELYLVRAEARAHGGNLDGALADLDAIRLRAGLPPSAAATGAAIRDAIAEERRREFFAEWGHRWFDLKRTARADAVLSVKAGWQPTSALFPIPLSELQRNPMLTQNPGY